MACCINCLHREMCTYSGDGIISGCPFFRDTHNFKRQIEDEAVKEFVDYLKSTQVSKMDYMGNDYIAIEDIELAEKEFEEML